VGRRVGCSAPRAILVRPASCGAFEVQEGARRPVDFARTRAYDGPRKNSDYNDSFGFSPGGAFMVSFTVNGKSATVDMADDTPLLWALRDHLGLTGTKFGCGISQCGACTVHVNGAPTRACVTPISAVAGKKITTIEGLSAKGDHPLQKAWVAEQVPQCGYCQSGQIMTAAALLQKNKKPSREQIVQHMSGNLCRCGTYNKIVTAIQRAAKEV
jgi:isoquinoline 1-oxidoreductase alpha subunit